MKSITISSPNTPPTITGIPSQSINQGTSTGNIAFTINDSQTSSNSLTITKHSSNTVLVPTSSINVGGSGSSRTVNITPTSNQSGTATVTLTVSDGSLSTSTSFNVQVTEASTPSTNIIFIHTDLLGSPIVETNSNGDIQ